MINGVVQEIDIRTGKVLFQWNSEDHVPFSQSEQPLPASPSTPWDWFHVNAVHIDADGNLLIDARDTWTTYKVNRFTGNIIWQLGGKDSSFKLRAAPGQSLDNAGEIFAWQHDPESIGHDEYTFFDNESAGTPEFPVSRAVTVKLDPRWRTATLIASDDQPEGLVGAVAGERPDDPRRRAVRGVGSASLLLGVRPLRTARVQRRVPDRREHLPRLRSPLASGRVPLGKHDPVGLGTDTQVRSRAQARDRTPCVGPGTRHV